MFGFMRCRNNGRRTAAMKTGKNQNKPQDGDKLWRIKTIVVYTQEKLDCEVNDFLASHECDKPQLTVCKSQQPVHDAMFVCMISYRVQQQDKS